MSIKSQAEFRFELGFELKGAFRTTLQKKQYSTMIRLGRVALRVAPRAARARALAPSRRAFSADANDGGNANATAERGAARAALAAAAAQQAAFVSEADQLTSGASQANLQVRCTPHSSARNAATPRLRLARARSR